MKFLPTNKPRVCYLRRKNWNIAILLEWNIHFPTTFIPKFEQKRQIRRKSKYYVQTMRCSHFSSSYLLHSSSLMHMCTLWCDTISHYTFYISCTIDHHRSIDEERKVTSQHTHTQMQLWRFFCTLPILKSQSPVPHLSTHLILIQEPVNMQKNCYDWPGCKRICQISYPIRSKLKNRYGHSRNLVYSLVLCSSPYCIQQVPTSIQVG